MLNKSRYSPKIPIFIEKMLTNDLFEAPKHEPEAISLLDADMLLYRQFFSEKESNIFFQQLLDEIQWQQGRIKVYGKVHDEPRLSAWYGDEGRSYTYSGVTRYAEAWTRTLIAIKHKIEEEVNIGFNSVLINLYRDGRDGVGWHSDDEPGLGKNPVIASVSLGESRVFQLRHKTEKGEKYSLNLTSGSFLLMRGTTQRYWQHQVPKTSKQLSKRINLTFRSII